MSQMLPLENLHVLCIIAIFYIKSFLKLGLFLIFFEMPWSIWYIEDLLQFIGDCLTWNLDFFKMLIICLADTQFFINGCCNSGGET